MGFVWPKKKQNMKKLFVFVFMAAAISVASAQDVKVITVVESIVPGGLGRSRIIEHGEQVSANDFTTERTDGKHSNQKNIKRKDLKASKLKETKLLNFYSSLVLTFRILLLTMPLYHQKLMKCWQTTGN